MNDFKSYVFEEPSKKDQKKYWEDWNKKQQIEAHERVEKNHLFTKWTKVHLRTHKRTSKKKYGQIVIETSRLAPFIGEDLLVRIYRIKKKKNKKEGKYLEFKLVEEKPKTEVFSVISKSSRAILGTIRWLGRWRQYVFEPATDFPTVWNDGCLDDISTFLKELRAKRKGAKK